MTRPATRPTITAALLALAATGLSAGTAAAAETVAATTPAAPAAQLGPDLTGSLQVPEDAKYYGDLGRIFTQTPLLGASGSIDWYFNRQLSSDDPRAIGVASARPFVVPTVDTQTTIPGTVELRGTGYNAYGYYDEGGTVIGAAGAVDGRNWIIDHAVTPRPARTVLRGVREGGSAPKNIRFGSNFGVFAVVPTDRGLRALGVLRTTVKGRSDSSIAVTAPGGTKPVVLNTIGDGLLKVAARPNGGLMLVGQGRGTVPDRIVLVDRAGRSTRLADRRDPAAPGFTARAGLASTAAGLVLDERSTTVASPANLDKSAVVLRSAKTGKVRIRKYLRDLEFPKDPACDSPTRHFHALDLTTGPDGQAVLTLACGNTRDVTTVDPYPPHRSWTNRRTMDDQAVMVGLRDDLTVSWWRPAPEVQAAPRERSDYNPPCTRTINDRDARLLVLSCDGTIRAITVPGAKPALGKLVRTTRVKGTSDVLARIRCNGAFGTVCSGRALLTANGQVIGESEYAVPGRPGGNAGQIDRAITAISLPKRVTVKLLPRP